MIDLVVPVYLVSDTDGRILLIRKSSGASSHDIFTLPGRELGIAIAVELPGMRPLRRLGYVRHSITHHRIRFEVWRASWEADLDRVDREIRWIEPGDLESIPHPSWVRKAIELGQS